MGTHEPDGATPVWLTLAAVGGVMACCAAPALLVLAGTGVGAALVHSGGGLAVGVGLAAALAAAGVVWRCRRTCPSPAVPALRWGHAPRPGDDDEAHPRAESTHAP